VSPSLGEGYVYGRRRLKMGPLSSPAGDFLKASYSDSR